MPKIDLNANHNYSILIQWNHYLTEYEPSPITKIQSISSSLFDKFHGGPQELLNVTESNLYSNDDVRREFDKSQGYNVLWSCKWPVMIYLLLLLVLFLIKTYRSNEECRTRNATNKTTITLFILAAVGVTTLLLTCLWILRENLPYNFWVSNGVANTRFYTRLSTPRQRKILFLENAEKKILTYPSDLWRIKETQLDFDQLMNIAAMEKDFKEMINNTIEPVVNQIIKLKENYNDILNATSIADWNLLRFKQAYVNEDKIQKEELLIKVFFNNGIFIIVSTVLCLSLAVCCAIYRSKNTTEPAKRSSKSHRIGQLLIIGQLVVLLTTTGFIIAILYQFQKAESLSSITSTLERLDKDATEIREQQLNLTMFTVMDSNINKLLEKSTNEMRRLFMEEINKGQSLVESFEKFNMDKEPERTKPHNVIKQIFENSKKVKSVEFLMSVFLFFLNLLASVLIWYSSHWMLRSSTEIHDERTETTTKEEQPLIY